MALGFEFEGIAGFKVQFVAEIFGDGDAAGFVEGDLNGHGRAVLSAVLMIAPNTTV